MPKIPKVLVILGQTATGKSDLAVKIALKFNGEIISADSRQVYKGMDIGTGKITKAEMQGIPHYLLDIADPMQRITVIDWRKIAEEKIKDIVKRGKLPIICGGTGFYIDSLINDTGFPDVLPDENLRKELEKKDLNDLVSDLLKLDSNAEKKIDLKNKRKVIRAIEIATALGHIPELKLEQRKDMKFLKIGLNLTPEELQARISKRLESRMKAGMENEARNLLKNGVTLERMREFGLEYRYLAELIQNEITYKDFMSILATRIWQFARRQMTWWRKDENIKWLNANSPTLLTDSEKYVSDFLNSK